VSTTSRKLRAMFDPKRVRRAIAGRPGEKLATLILSQPGPVLYVALLAPLANVNKWAADIEMRGGDFLIIAMTNDGSFEIAQGVSSVQGLPLGLEPRDPPYTPPPAFVARMVAKMLDREPPVRLSEGWAAQLARQ
jgi:hypothetical protein